MKHFLLLFLMLVVTILRAQTFVAKTSSGIAIDGHLEEEIWSITNSFGVNIGDSDNTASFGLLWDDFYLYVGVEVVDETLSNGHRQAFMMME